MSAGHAVSSATSIVYINAAVGGRSRRSTWAAVAINNYATISGSHPTWEQLLEREHRFLHWAVPASLINPVANGLTLRHKSCCTLSPCIHQTRFAIMASSSRRVPPPQTYGAVPTSPTRSTGSHTPMNSLGQQQQYQQPLYGARPPARSPSTGSSAHMHQQRGAVAQDVATGAIGGGYGPYAVSITSWHLHHHADLYSSTTRKQTGRMRPRDSALRRHPKHLMRCGRVRG